MPNDLPSTLYVPARFDWLQHLAERFSLFIDALSRQLSTVLGSWSRQPSSRRLSLVWVKPDESAKYQ